VMTNTRLVIFIRFALSLSAFDSREREHCNQ
jgi:hypothetical protein